MAYVSFPFQVPAGGSPALTPPRRPIIDTSTPGVRVIRVIGRVDRGTGARVSRLVDAQLAITHVDGCKIRHVVLDLDDAEIVDTEAVPGLNEAHAACRRRRITLHLSGGFGDQRKLGLQASAQLRSFSHFPDLGIALNHLATAPA
ncbi:STAS domain-containing protein [Pseudonocardia endophytica]|uniref:STAS domain-containing protein n=1 Tax=Pseudonocardia endophytica TaxID=401976 RepID=A0A4R1I0J1_PSEEN|nr:STAS domain-containing protein [Pseudonocardia endophytica]TCK26730.1 STAS domain-containing protein [Pseudonocardia endophytica]